MQCDYTVLPCSRCKDENAVCVSGNRGRRRSREISPGLFQHSVRALSHSPPSRFYHGESGEAGNGPPTPFPLIPEAAKTEQYQYAPLSASSIRLLRISPGAYEDPIHCALKAMSLHKITASLLEFQALSYAWSHGGKYEIILLQDVDEYDQSIPRPSAGPRPFQVQDTLFHALKRIRQRDVQTWIWIDAVCIDQTSSFEKSHQIPKMPDIYSNAWNVVVWLGEDSETRVKSSLSLIPHILNLKTLDSMLENDNAEVSMLQLWVHFGELLQLPWFTRRWYVMSRTNCTWGIC
jgi:hypothetical protein